MRKLVVSEWRKLTSDRWVLDTVENGYQIEFNALPTYSSYMKEINFSEEKSKIVSLEVNKLIEKGAIKKVDHMAGQFISNIFLVPKKDGSLRPVINLKNLNLFVEYQHFKQERLSFALDLIERNDYLTSIDLTDAYFSISIHENFKKFLRFTWKENLYEFQVLCFGLASAPRVFTKVLKPVYAFFRKIGIKCIYYIDDSLTMNKDFNVCLNNSNLMTKKLDDLGFQVNLKKSVLIPTKRIIFFGLIIDTSVFRIFLTDEKIDKIISLGRMILSEDTCIIIRVVASFIGLIVHACNAVTFGPLHYRCLERDKVKALRECDDDFNGMMSLSKNSRQEVFWWVSNISEVNGKLIRPDPIDCWIETDASLQGWGANFEGSRIGGRWSLEEKSYHINYLELLAIFYSLKAFFGSKSSLHVGIKSDNTSAVAYLNEMGGMSSVLLDSLSSEIWEWCASRKIFITAQYIPGSENFDADFMSRNFTDSTEWMLKSEIFERICGHFFRPDIDLFASRLNNQLPSFVSWSYDPKAKFTDAFSFSWSNLRPYIFPPFSLIGKIISKIISDKVEKAIIIVPFWPTQNWFSILLSVLISLPARLPRHADLLRMPHSGEVHPLLKRLNLTVCLVSGRPSLVQEFRMRQLKLSSHHGDHQQLDNMNTHGANMYFGAVEGALIPFVRLRRM